MWKSEQHRLKYKYDMLNSFVPLIKYHHETWVNDDKKNSKLPFNIVMNMYNVLEKVEK